MTGLIQDIHYGCRLLRRNPGFTVAAVLSLALGIGVNAVIFSLFYALLLQMLPVQRPQDLVLLYRTGGWGKGYMSFPLYRDIRDQTSVLEGVLARSAVQRTSTGQHPAGCRHLPSMWRTTEWTSLPTSQSWSLPKIS